MCNINILKRNVIVYGSIFNKMYIKIPYFSYKTKSIFPKCWTQKTYYFQPICLSSHPVRKSELQNICEITICQNILTKFLTFLIDVPFIWYFRVWYDTLNCNKRLTDWWTKLNIYLRVVFLLKTCSFIIIIQSSS